MRAFRFGGFGLGMFPLILTALNRDYSTPSRILRTDSIRGNIPTLAFSSFGLWAAAACGLRTWESHATLGFPWASVAFDKERRGSPSRL